MTESLTISAKVHFCVGRRSQKILCSGERPNPTAGRIPRVAKLMALAIRFEQLIQEGVVENQAELAQLGHVSRARVTQIMNLLNLAPDIQESLFLLPQVKQGRDLITERDLRVIVSEHDWRRQRRLWKDSQKKVSNLPE